MALIVPDNWNAGKIILQTLANEQACKVLRTLQFIVNDKWSTSFQPTRRITAMAQQSMRAAAAVVFSSMCVLAAALPDQDHHSAVMAAASNNTCQSLGCHFYRRGAPCACDKECEAHDDCCVDYS